MTLIELIGFVIVLVAMFVLMLKRAFDERRRRKNPEQYAAEEKQAMQELLRSLDLDVEDIQELEAVAHAEPIEVKEEEEVEPIVPLAIENSPILRRKKKADPQVAQLLRSKKNLRNAIVLNEIIGAPRAFH